MHDLLSRMQGLLDELKRNNEMILLADQSRNEVIDLPVLAVLLSVVRGASEVTVSGTTETMIK